MQKRHLEVRCLGRFAYDEGLRLQKELEQKVIEEREKHYLLLLEHPHTFTIGRRAEESGVLASEEKLKKAGISVFETNRGGKVTYHGIGQIVGYPIINLAPDRKDVHKYVRDLEEVLIRTMANFDIKAFRLEGLTGVHTEDGKVAAIGVHLKRWVTTHGFALNVNTDLSFFDQIIACEGEPVASMERILGRELILSEVEDKIAENFAEVFDCEIEISRTSIQRYKFKFLDFEILSITAIMERKNGSWTITSTTQKFKNEFIEVNEDEVIQPDGKNGKYATVEMKAGCCSLPIDADGNVYLVRQFRYALRAESLEAVCGAMENEKPIDAAKREVKEELGIEAADWQSLGTAETDTSIVHCPAHFFVARDLEFKEPEREGTETIKTVKMSLDEAVEKVLSGEIKHALSCLVILKARLLNK